MSTENDQKPRLNLKSLHELTKKKAFRSDLGISKSICVIRCTSVKSTTDLLRNRQNRLRFVYTHFRSGDQSLGETSFEFLNIFPAMLSCAVNA